MAKYTQTWTSHVRQLYHGSVLKTWHAQYPNNAEVKQQRSLSTAQTAPSAISLSLSPGPTTMTTCVSTSTFPLLANVVSTLGSPEPILCNMDIHHLKEPLGPEATQVQYFALRLCTLGKVCLDKSRRHPRQLSYASEDRF